MELHQGIHTCAHRPHSYMHTPMHSNPLAQKARERVWRSMYVQAIRNETLPQDGTVTGLGTKHHASSVPGRLDPTSSGSNSTEQPLVGGTDSAHRDLPCNAVDIVGCTGGSASKIVDRKHQRWWPTPCSSNSQRATGVASPKGSTSQRGDRSG